MQIQSRSLDPTLMSEGKHPGKGSPVPGPTSSTVSVSRICAFKTIWSAIPGFFRICWPTLVCRKGMLVYCTPDLFRGRFARGDSETFWESSRPEAESNEWKMECRHQAEEGEHTLNLNTVLPFFEGALPAGPFPAGRSYGELGGPPGRFWPFALGIVSCGPGCMCRWYVSLEFGGSQWGIRFGQRVEIRLGANIS